MTRRADSSLAERGLWLCGFFLLWTAGSGLATEQQKEVQRLLERMAEAVRVLDYAGTFVYLNNNQLEAMRIVHKVGQGREQERLVSLNGSPREVVRNKDSVTCILPNFRNLSVDRRKTRNKFPPMLPMDLDVLKEQYEFRVLGESRVVGRSTRIVGIIPRDDLRYGYRLYLDEETGLPLKSDLMDESATPVEQIMFTSLDLNPDFDVEESELETSSEIQSSNQMRRPKIPPDPSLPPRWTFANLPSGFALSIHNRWPDDEGMGVEHYVLSDGLASMSVYIEKPDSQVGLRGGSRMGAVNAWGGEVDGFQVTVVGAVPEATVKHVIEIATYTPDQSAQ